MCYNITVKHTYSLVREQKSYARNGVFRMIQLKTYRGHIRNWEALCTELSIDKTLSREAREQEILIR